MNGRKALIIIEKQSFTHKGNREDCPYLKT